MLQASGIFSLDKWSTDTYNFFYDRLLEACKNETIVRSQDLFTLVRYVSLNKYGESMAWDWVTLNWDYLVKRWVCQNKRVRKAWFLIKITANKLFTHLVNHVCAVSLNTAIKQQVNKIDICFVILSAGLYLCLTIWFRYTITDRNLGRLLNRISTSYNTELKLWKVNHPHMRVYIVYNHNQVDKWGEKILLFVHKLLSEYTL